MSQLHIVNQTYHEFFSDENCSQVCETEAERNIVRAIQDRIPIATAEMMLQELDRRGPATEFRQDDQVDAETITHLVNSLKMIISRFRNSADIKREIVREFPEFKKNRVKTVKSLRKLARSINKDRFVCNVSKEVSSSVGFVGGGMCLCAAGVTLLTGGAAAPLLVCGAAAAGVGGASNLVTSVTEMTLLSKDIRKAQKIIKKDSKNLRQTFGPLEQSMEVKQAIEEIMGIDLFKQTVKEFGDFFREVLVYKQKISDLDEKVRRFLSAFVQDKSLCNWNFWINASTLIVGFLFALVFLHGKRQVFASGLATLHLAISMARVLDVGVDATVTAVSTVRGVNASAAVTRSIGQATARGSIAVLGMTLDAVNIVLTAIDMRKGSVSQHAVKIRDFADRLEAELKSLQCVYDEFLAL